jgi:hypothetical protein
VGVGSGKRLEEKKAIMPSSDEKLTYISRSFFKKNLKTKNRTIGIELSQIKQNLKKGQKSYQNK